MIDMSQHKRDELAQAAVKAAVAEFADRPSHSSTHGEMVNFMIDWLLREHGQHANVAAISDLSPAGGTVFKFFFFETVAKARFTVMT